MSIMLKRREARRDAEEALSRLQELAREQAERLAPYTEQARETAALRLNQARGWTAPRLETAALRVEDTVAPRVAGLLTAAAHRVEPALPVAKRRRMPRSLVIIGAGALGAAAVYGVLRLRQASQDAEWQANLDSAREQVRQTRDQLAAKAREARGKMRGAAGSTATEAAGAEDTASETSQELNGRVKQ
ncbi:hypothetical protein [Actinorugispora endophytica]|uniref:DUF3618 domain-containing protein n=1 Tax=Actinorugispora endophytica TaxID=1605990 RepID=A0A4R6V2K5_9ACTN|nr:hypothetical protein [Actinorugispora endophytica]TDQ52324.1 hypothetical protein EV190_107157 [Actinorugispora endophytica]